MSEENVDPNADPVADDAADEAAELVSLAVDDGKGGKVVPLSALITSKKEAKAHARRVKELEPVAQETETLRKQIADAQPYINALIADPRLRAEAIRLAQGGQPQHEQQQQDAEAQEYAEMHGLYLTDGITPDATKARRMINWHDQRSKRTTEEAIRPWAGFALNGKAEQNVQAAIAAVDDEGVPLATEESIREIVSQMPAHLLADPRVVEIVLNNAIGIDRRTRRTPKPVDEPLYLDTPRGRRRSEPVVDAQLKGTLERLGLTEKDFTEADKATDQSARTRKGITLGKW